MWISIKTSFQIHKKNFIQRERFLNVPQVGPILIGPCEVITAYFRVITAHTNILMMFSFRDFFGVFIVFLVIFISLDDYDFYRNY